MSSPAKDSPIPLEQFPEPQPVKQSFWKSVTGAMVVAVVFAMLIFMVTSAADWLLLKEHETPRMTIELSDASSAAAIGMLIYKLVRLHQDRRARVRQRVEVIADMNHHVRNALQVISLSSVGRDKEEITAIRESVNRIQWALRELLPKI